MRDYLRKVWMDNNSTHSVESNLENVKRERDLILNVSSPFSLAKSAD